MSAFSALPLSGSRSNGYDQTSLREIAEDLGVTKAALYHHFKSKEEILDALLDDVAAELKAARGVDAGGPPTRERRLEAIHRLGELTRGAPGGVIRCVQQNEVALQNLGSTTEMVHEFKRKLWQSALPADASLEAKLRMRMAVMTVLVATKMRQRPWRYRERAGRGRASHRGRPGSLGSGGTCSSRRRARRHLVASRVDIETFRLDSPPCQIPSFPTTSSLARPPRRTKSKEGATEGGRLPSIWDTFSHTPRSHAQR